jgi:hypothetical protein
MTMTSYQSVETALETLKRERDKLNAAIAALEVLVTTNGNSSTATSRAVDTPGPVPVVSTQYARMTMKEASVHFLRSLPVHEPQSTRIIADAIRAGGIRTQSASLYRTLYNVLNVDSERDNGLIAKIGSNFGLKEWGNV